MNTPYTPNTLEPKWQAHWAQHNAFTAEANASKPKYYVLEMLPYPSGQLHMGHVRNYTLGDVLARYKRAQGYNVLHPMGWDSFGLPAENAAIKRKTHPQTWTLQNIADMKAVMQRMGWSYDWSKEITSCLPSYYGPQQSLFLDLYEKGLVYRGEALVNWDPVDQTVLANEQVVDGKGWRSGAAVERRTMPQWFMKITHYADQLLADLDALPGWPERVKTMQANWLGKSQGLQFSFKVSGGQPDLTVFTTRPDTLYGVSFCAVAPEHPLAQAAAQTDPAAAAFIAEAAALGTAQEIIDKAEKKGVKTPFTATHPITGAQLPIYIANFVLMTYGTGAIMATPAHDERDHAFAVKYGLPVLPVIQGLAEAPLPYTGPGTLVNSGPWNGLSVAEALSAAIKQAETEGWGTGTTQWRLRDWGISRQRYWGAPIPFIHCGACGVVPVPKNQLPVELPQDVEFTGSGNPLASHPTWKHCSCPKCSAPAERETDTMDTFMDSSWYFLRYMCPDSPEPLDKTKVAYWMGADDGRKSIFDGRSIPPSHENGSQSSTIDHRPSTIEHRTSGVDQYIGGIEHAVLHLLYARFFTKALRDCGYPVGGEPFKALLCQGMVIGNTYQAPDGSYIYPSQVEWRGEQAFLKGTEILLKVSPAEKISKSKNNGDSPEGLIARFGADALRLYMLFTAPPERDLEWSEAAIDGAKRFLNRLWTLVHSAGAANGTVIPVPASAGINSSGNNDLSLSTGTVIPAQAGIHDPKPAHSAAVFDNTPAERAIRRKTHQTIAKITRDIEHFQYNTMVAAGMELLNTLTAPGAAQHPAAVREGAEMLLRLLNPAIPHITEELWATLHDHSNVRPLDHRHLWQQNWPVADTELAKNEEITLVVQVNGKVRAKLQAPADIDEPTAIALAKAAPDVHPHLTGPIAKAIYVPGRLVNLALS